MTDPNQQPPILLSVCIPTYNRQELLAYNLDKMKWLADTGLAIEIIVSDNASEDDTERVIQEKGRMFPHFRYIRQARNIGPENNFVSVMRLARGKFFVELCDDNRLIQENLLNELDYMNKHDDIVASHAPWLIWSDITNTDHDLFYNVEEPVTFEKKQSTDLFNYIVAHHIFPEHAICRTESFTKVLFRTHGVLKEMVWNFRALDYGKIRFQPNPWLLHIGDSPIHTARQGKEGVQGTLTSLDQYRGALEMAAYIAMANIGMEDFSPGNREEVLDIINEFISGRLHVNARIAQKFGDFIGASEFLKRRLLWVRTEEQRQEIRALEQVVTPGAIFQAMGELFDLTPGAKHLVLCALPNAENMQAQFRELTPAMPTVIRDLPTALNAPDRYDCLYLTNNNETRSAIGAAGIEFGRVTVLSELLHMFRITI